MMSGLIVFSIVLITTIAFMIGISLYQANLLSRTPLFQCGYNLTVNIDKTCKDRLTISKDQFLIIKKECIDNNIGLFPPKFQEYIQPCLNEYEIGDEVCNSHNKFKKCLKKRASKIDLKPAVNEYVQMISNKTGKPLLITDRVQNTENETTINQTINDTGPQIGDAITGTIRVANKIKAEDTNKLNEFDFSDEQINECNKMTTCLSEKLLNLPYTMQEHGGIELQTAQNAG